MAYFNLDFMEGRNPVQEDLLWFVEQAERLVHDVIEGNVEGIAADEMGLFPPLRNFAREALGAVHTDFGRLREALHALPPNHEGMIAHGLVGVPQRFKLEVIQKIELTPDYYQSARRWLRILLGAVGVILSSILQALGIPIPVGGMTLEIMKLIRALL